MQMLAGGCLGFAAGVGVWFASRHFVAHYGAQPSQEHPTGGRALLGEAQGTISLPAALTQAGMALWGAYAGWQAAGLEQVVAALLVTGLLLAITLVDFQVRRIPNVLVLALLIWALVQPLWLGQPTLVAAALGLLAGGGLFLLLALIGRGAMGAGDVKLAAALGAVVGFPHVLPALFLGAVAGGAAALVLLATRRAGRKDYMAYGPYLALGAWLIWTRSLGLWL
jgi:leader peptidase (prepilin peptidase)/N-methyltransferase